MPSVDVHLEFATEEQKQAFLDAFAIFIREQQQEATSRGDTASGEGAAFGESLTLGGSGVQFAHMESAEDRLRRLGLRGQPAEGAEGLAGGGGETIGLPGQAGQPGGGFSGYINFIPNW